MSEPKETLDTYALVELMGHQRIVGRVTEATLAGGAFLRVDVDAFNGAKAFTRFYSPGSIYCISPISEEIARGLMARNRNEPVSRFELPQLAEKVDTQDESAEDSNDNQEGEDDDQPDYCPECHELTANCTCE